MKNSEMAELFGKTIDEYSKEELWKILEDFLKPAIKTDEDLNKEVEFFIDSCKAVEPKEKISSFFRSFFINKAK